MFSKKPDTSTVFHEVARNSNLDLILRGFNGAFNRFTDTLGHGFEILALALSTKEDNSGEIRDLATRIKAVREKLQTSVDNQTKGD